MATTCDVPTQFTIASCEGIAGGDGGSGAMGEGKDLETTAAAKPDKGTLGRWCRVIRRRDKTRSAGSKTSKS